MEDLDVDGRKILKCVFKKWVVGGMDWIDMAQDTDMYWAIVRTVVNVRIH